MLTHEHRWELRERNSGVLVAVLPFKDADFPWVICHFEPMPLFKDHKPLFDELSSLDEDNDERGDELDEELNRRLKLVLVSGEWPEIARFLMHIGEEEAHFQVIFAK